MAPGRLRGGMSQRVHDNPRGAAKPRPTRVGGKTREPLAPAGPRTVARGGVRPWRTQPLVSSPSEDQLRRSGGETRRRRALGNGHSRASYHERTPAAALPVGPAQGHGAWAGAPNLPSPFQGWRDCRIGHQGLRPPKRRTPPLATLLRPYGPEDSPPRSVMHLTTQPPMTRVDQAATIPRSGRLQTGLLRLRMRGPRDAHRRQGVSRLHRLPGWARA